MTFAINRIIMHDDFELSQHVLRKSPLLLDTFYQSLSPREFD